MATGRPSNGVLSPFCVEIGTFSVRFVILNRVENRSNHAARDAKRNTNS